MAYYNPPYGQPQVPYPGPYPGPVAYYAGPAVMYPAPVTESYVLHFSKATSTILGGLQIVLGCLSISAGGMALGYYASLSEVGTGIWCGIMFLVAGAIAAAAGSAKTNQLIISTAFFSVFNILLGITELTVASVGVAEDIYSYNKNLKDLAITANSMMIGIGALIIILGSWLLVVSCRAIDKGNKIQTVTNPVGYGARQPETVFVQAPAYQPQPFPGYYGQPQYPLVPNSQQQLQNPSIPNSQYVMNPGAQQTPPRIVKPGDRPPRY